jgi:hypothetical protein
MKFHTVVILILSSLLFGCSWIESDAGKAHYRYAITMPDGTRHEVDLQNAKDIGLVSATLKYGEMEVELIEEGVNASSAMGAMAEQNGKLVDLLVNTINPIPGS